MARVSAIERFSAAAAELGFHVDARRYPEGSKTAIDAASAIGCVVGQIVKSLIFASDDSLVLALTSGANRVDPAKLAEAHGSPMRRADADQVRQATGFAIGGVPPFGHDSVMPVYFDPALFEFDIVWAAAGTPDSVFPIEPAELQRLTGAVPAAFASH